MKQPKVSLNFKSDLPPNIIDGKLSSFLEKCFQIILLSIGIVSYSFIVTKFGNYIMKKSKEDIELEEKKLQLEQIRINYQIL